MCVRVCVYILHEKEAENNLLELRCMNSSCLPPGSALGTDVPREVLLGEGSCLETLLGDVTCQRCHYLGLSTVKIYSLD